MTTTVDRAGPVYKTATATVTKIDDGDGNGSFEALVAVFDNIDSHGDKVLKGAFTESLKTKDVWPVVWAHQFHDDTAIIGKATAEETDTGLIFKAEFLGTPRAQHVRALMQAGLITEFSWSGRIAEGGWIESEDEGSYYELRKVDLWEAGPCFVGANQDTELIGIKSGIDRLAASKTVNLDHVDVLKAIRSTIDDVLAETSKTHEEPAGTPPASPEPPGDQPGTQDASATAGAFVISPTLKARLALTGK